MMVQLLGDIFRCTFLDTVPMENQLSQMCQKVHRLKVLKHDLKDTLIAAVIVMSLLDSYVMNIEWDYNYYQPWSNHKWLVDEMMAMLDEDIIMQ